MSIHILRGSSDAALEQVINALRCYQAEHPQAEIAVYRQNSVSIRVRIIDEYYRGKSRSQRIDIAWPYLESLPEEMLGDITTVLLLTPEETRDSFANVEFEEPVHSQL